MQAEVRTQRELVWLSAALPKMKRFPALKDVVGVEPQTPKRAKTPAEIEHTMRRWQVQMATAAAQQEILARRRGER